MRTGQKIFSRLTVKLALLLKAFGYRGLIMSLWGNIENASPRFSAKYAVVASLKRFLGGLLIMNA